MSETFDEFTGDFKDEILYDYVENIKPEIYEEYHSEILSVTGIEFKPFDEYFKTASNKRWENFVDWFDSDYIRVKAFDKYLWKQYTANSDEYDSEYGGDGNDD